MYVYMSEYVHCKRETETPMERDTQRDPNIDTETHSYLEIQGKRDTESDIHTCAKTYTHLYTEKQERKIQ